VGGEEGRREGSREEGRARHGLEERLEECQMRSERADCDPHCRHRSPNPRLGWRGSGWATESPEAPRRCRS
jgi:hypothetical protein